MDEKMLMIFKAIGVINNMCSMQLMKFGKLWSIDLGHVLAYFIVLCMH